MKIAILGLGSIGRRHGRNFRLLGETNLIGFDPSNERRIQFVSECAGQAVPTLEEALASRPDLAVVSSPNRFHMAQALAAAEAGCHLFVEKPLSHNLDHVDELQDIIARRQLFAHVGSNFKFHPAFSVMKRLIDEGALGMVTGAQIIAGQWLPDWHPWEDYRDMYSAKKALGGGVLLDTHEFIYTAWLLGAVTGVSGFAAHSGALDIETEDVAAVCLRFERGAVATLLLDYIQREYRRRYHISGSEGTIEWDIRQPHVLHYNAATKATATIAAEMQDFNDMYVAQARHVLAGVRGEVAPQTPVSEGRAVLEIVSKLKAANV